MPGYLGLLLEELFEESAKTDFKDKFGEQTFQNFEKAKQRLKNNNMSVDYGQYLKMDKEDVDNLILSLYDDEKDAQKKRVLKGEDKEIRGKYNYLGEKGGYKIYQPLDVQASMDLGVNTGWCTTGRYGHYGHPEFTPSEEDAERHFNDYTERYGIKLYYFLNPSTMYGEYAVALYPTRMLNVNKIVNGIYVSSTNFELFNAEDELDYSAVTKLPLDIIPDINIESYKLDTVTGYPESLELLSIEEARELPESVIKYGASWWLRSHGKNPYNADFVHFRGEISDLGKYVQNSYIAVCPALKISNPKPSNLELYGKYLVNNESIGIYNEFIGIYIGDNKFLYKGRVIYHRFDSESNDYETSDIKQYLNIWLKELQSKSKDMKESLTGIADRMKLLEELFEESAKTDFRDKFGEQTLQNFDKARQRLKNNNLSVDYGQYLKMDKEEVDNLILSLYDDKKDAQRKRMIKGEDKEIRGKYNYLGEKGGYKIYQPLDVQASMDLGVNTGWCTTGRYGHYGHPEFTPSEREAAKHFDRYTKDYKIKLYYFLNPDTMYGEYAIALYPRILNIEKEINGSYVSSTNFELFTAEDKLDFSAMDKLPLDVIPDINIVSQKLDVVNGYPESLELLSIEEAEKLPESVRKYTSVYWLRSPSRRPFYASHYAACVSSESWILDFGVQVHRKPLAVRPVLKISNPKPSDLELYKKYYVNNDKFMGIYIGDNKFLYTGKVIKQRFNKEPDNYDEESNNYETSEIKQFVDKWLKKLQNKSKKMKESLNESVNANEPIIDFLKNINFGDEFDFEKVGDWEISAWITSPRHNFSDGFYIVQIDNDKLNKHYTIPDSQSKGEFESKKDKVIKRMKESLNRRNNKMTLNEYKRSRNLKEGFYPSDYDEELEYDWYDEGLTFDRDTPSKYEFDNAREAKAALSTALSHGYVDSWREGVFVYIAGRKEKGLKEDFYWDEEDSFFTREDLDEFQSELEYELPEVVFHKTYFEPGNSLEVDWDYEGWEETTKVKVDMRRIRYPRDLIRRYAPIVIGMIKDSYEKMERELNESYLKEDWDSLRDLAEEMINYLNDNDVSWVDIYRINDDGPLSSITLEIDGDWKHDHLRANYLLNMKYGDRIKSIQDYSLEDTGNDWGKEAHVIRLK